MKRTLIIILFYFTLFSVNAMDVDNNWNYSFGLSAKQLSLAVYQKGQNTSLGNLTAEFIFTPELIVENNTNYISDSNWAYKFVFRTGLFKMNTQEVNLEDINLGTSADGYYFYALPMIYYDFSKDDSLSSLLLGIGFGAGFLHAKGDIVFTQANPQSRHNFNISELTYSAGFALEYHRNSWVYSVYSYSPQVNSGAYEYNLFDTSISVRKKFNF